VTPPCLLRRRERFSWLVGLTLPLSGIQNTVYREKKNTRSWVRSSDGWTDRRVKHACRPSRKKYRLRNGPEYEDRGDLQKVCGLSSRLWYKVGMRRRPIDLRQGDAGLSKGDGNQRRHPIDGSEDQTRRVIVLDHAPREDGIWSRRRLEREIAFACVKSVGNGSAEAPSGVTRGNYLGR
jgi:hypothetical protein